MSDKMSLEQAANIADDCLNSTINLHTFGEFREAMRILITHARKDLTAVAPKVEEQLEGQMDISDYGIQEAEEE